MAAVEDESVFDISPDESPPVTDAPDYDDFVREYIEPHGTPNPIQLDAWIEECAPHSERSQTKAARRMANLRKIRSQSK